MAGGRKGKNAPPPQPSRTLILDNGAYSIKAGLVTTLAAARDPAASSDTDTQTPVVIPNCIARDRHRRTYIASELARCKDFGEASFRRPVEKGYIVNWEAERAIWDFELGSEGSVQCDPSDTRLVLTEQPNALAALQANCDQMVFEEFQFASYVRGTAAQFTAYLDLAGEGGGKPHGGVCGPAEIRLVIDSGYSFTTVTPVLHGRPIHAAVRRLDVGGKLLTNYLTKLLSMRHYDMRHDTYIVNEIKEKACYVSLDFAGDLDRAWKGTRSSGIDDQGERQRRLALARSGNGGIAKEYVLPDYQRRMEGIVRDYDPVAATAAARAKRMGGGGNAAALAGTAEDEDTLTLRNERFVVPELLFHPADVGLQQPGLPDVVAQSVACLPVGLWPALLSNIVVVGGNAELPGFVQRLQEEIQQRMPDDLVVRVTRPADPTTCTWRGAAQLAGRPENAAVVNALAVTKQQYEENGAAWVARKFMAGLGID